MTWVTGGAFQYSDSYTLAGASHPTTWPSGETTGWCLGVYAARSSALQYTQDVYLTAWSYTLTFKYQIRRSSSYTQTVSNRYCWVIINGTTTYDTSFSVTTYETWTTRNLSFSLSSDGWVTVSLWYKAANQWANYCPRIFFDDISIS